MNIIEITKGQEEGGLDVMTLNGQPIPEGARLWIDENSVRIDNMEIYDVQVFKHGTMVKYVGPRLVVSEAPVVIDAPPASGS